MSIANRLQRIESLAGGKACPACGESDVATGATVSLGRIDLDAEPAKPVSAERCLACGRMPFASQFHAIQFDGGKEIA